MVLKSKLKSKSRHHVQKGGATTTSCCSGSGSGLWIFAAVLILAIGGAALFVYMSPSYMATTNQKIIVVQQPQSSPDIQLTQAVKPDLFPEPVTRLGTIGYGRLPRDRVRGGSGPLHQVGILTGEGGSSTSAAPDRTILPLYGRELDPRRSRWNYYTRTDGANPVQVPVRVGNRVCDDDTNGCNEVSNDDSVQVPALGRSFKATVYRRSF